MDGGAWKAAVHGVAEGWTQLSDFTFMHWRRKWQPTPVFLPGESRGRGSLVGCRLWGRRVGHDWSDLAAAAAAAAFHTIKYRISWESVISSFHSVELCSLCMQFGKRFLSWMVLIFIPCFSSIYWDDYVGFFFCWYGVSYSFVYFKPSLWPWDESSLVMVFDVLLDLVC